jgi:hypothetical protein
MIEFLKNIIPRIKKYSNELDKTENFVDKDWVFINPRCSICSRSGMLNTDNIGSPNHQQ